MLGYLSETAFVGKLSFDIFMWIVILLITFYCIRRNPTDFDTNYRKRNRTVLGMLCFISAVGFLFLDLVLSEEVTLRNYFLSIFGTFTPNETMIQYGMGPNVPIREVGVKSVFALPTLEQWLVLRKVSNFALMSTLGIMCLFYKKSSIRIIPKVRKVLGYISLLFLVPAAFDSLYYFDFEEFIFVAVVCLITWLLLRTYQKDAKTPTLPTESVQYGENEDFAPIAPEE
jgi:peptidoglycan/LPS O-acetylase OafA/YrhL